MARDDKIMKRREFLESIGRAAGSSVMLRTMAAIGIATSAASCGSSSASGNQSPPVSPPPPPPPPNRMQSPRPGDWPANVGAGRSVVILGGGISGMTAAYEMTRLGYSCTILEATNRAGGRNRTIRGLDQAVETDSTQTCQFDADPDLYFNAGPARIAHHHEFLIGYCRQFGVVLETFTNDNRAALLHSTTWFGGQPQIQKRVLADTRGNIAELLASAVNQGALDLELTPTDRSNILSMLRNFGVLDSAFNYNGTSRAGFPGQEDVGSRQRGETLTPLDLSELISDTLMQARTDFPQGLEQQPLMLQPVGGMDRIAEAFETQVGQDITYNAEVTEIRKIANGSRIVYEIGGVQQPVIDADFCVCTIPATVLRNIPNDFSVNHQSEIQNFNYAQATKIAYQSRRFWEQDHNIYGGISWTNQSITQVWYPSAGYGRDQGIIVGSYIFGGQAGVDFSNQTPAQRDSSTAAQANLIHAEFGTEVTRGISVAWPKVPFQLGAWGTSQPNVLLTPDENIFFAGEHLSILQGWQEGAILSAYHAIDNIVAVS